MGATGVVVETRVADIFIGFIDVFVDKYFFQAKMNPYSSNAIKITPCAPIIHTSIQLKPRFCGAFKELQTFEEIRCSVTKSPILPGT